MEVDGARRIHVGRPCRRAGSTVMAPFLPVSGLRQGKKYAGIFSLQRNIERWKYP
jgi:hypothetical protein